MEKANFRKENTELFNLMYENVNNIVYSLNDMETLIFTDYILSILNNLRKSTSQFLIFKLEEIGNKGKQFSLTPETLIFINEFIQVINLHVKEGNFNEIKRLILELKPQAEIIVKFVKQYEHLFNRNIEYLYKDVKKTINKIFMKNKGLAENLAKKMKPSHVSFQDILQRAYLGLHVAILKYYPCDIEFSTYSHNWIKQAIIEETVTANLLTMDAKAVKQYRDIKDKINEIRDRQLTENIENLNVIHSLSEQEQALVYAMFPLSMETPVYNNKDGDELTLGDTLTFSEASTEDIENKIVIDNIIGLLSKHLSENEIYSLLIESNLYEYLPHRNMKVLRLNNDKYIRKVYYQSAKEKIFKIPELKDSLYSILTA